MKKNDEFNTKYAAITITTENAASSLVIKNKFNVIRLFFKMFCIDNGAGQVFAKERVQSVKLFSHT